MIYHCKAHSLLPAPVQPQRLEHPCKLTINLDESGDIQIIMIGIIAHKIENRVGVYCTSIDNDSVTHLRRLGEYNLGDIELVNRDFDALTHKH